MSATLPSIIVTGASGFIGRYFLDYIKEQYTVFAIARRTAKEANISDHPNIHWIQWDISNPTQIHEVTLNIQRRGGADFLLHLAAYYDFNFNDDVAYHRTNIEGTKNMIEVARVLKVKRFLFSSSLAACNFPRSGETICEKTPADANYAYANTKKAGEAMLLELSKDVPATVIRFAAVFSDWCEYPPLYKFLGTWLSKGYDSRILGGKGNSAVPYIHIHDVVRQILTILQNSHVLPSYDVYAASPDGSTSHRDLFSIATKDFFGLPVKPIFLPRVLAYPGIALRILLGKLKITPPPFERFWMLKYIDLKLDTDSSYTRSALGWEPLNRLHINRRLLFLLARMKSSPMEWHMRNEAALKHISVRTNLLIYEILTTEKERLLSTINASVFSSRNSEALSHYQQMEQPELNLVLHTLYNVVASTILNTNRSLLISYIDDIAFPRFDEGFTAAEISALLSLYSEHITANLQKSEVHQFTRQDLYDYISIPIQLAQDEIEEKYESYVRAVRYTSAKKMVKIRMDGIDVSVEADLSILDAARSQNIHIPTLCYHKDLMIAGNCRVCLVELENTKQLIASCATPVEEGMVIHTSSLKVRTARRAMLELLLSEHFTDCTNCYKNGKCELQNLASEFKIINPTYLNLHKEEKATLDIISPALVKDDRKCIRCQRCVRTCSQIQGVSAVWVAHKGGEMKISTYLGKSLYEVFCTNCGQCIDRCPTGALVEKNYIEEVWNAIWSKEKHVIVQTAPAVRVAIGEDLGIEPGKRVTGKLVTALRRLGFDTVLDTAFSADVTTIEEGDEFLDRLRRRYLLNDQSVSLPIITSCSPAWIKFMEHAFPDSLEHLSTCKSPQQMFGVLAKTYYAKTCGLKPENIVTVSIMPCTAKKFEADRPEMRSSGYKDIDYVLTTRELAIMIIQAGIDFRSLPNDHYDTLMGKASGAGVIYGATGGVMESVLRTVHEKVTGRDVPFENLVIQPVRGMAGIKEIKLKLKDCLEQWSFLNGVELHLAVAHGLANARFLIEDVRNKPSQLHFVEVMACLGGCLGGGGQPIPTNPEIRLKRVQALYAEEMGMEIRKAHENPEVISIYKDFLNELEGNKAEELLHTHYTKRKSY
ncbi:MAG: NADH-dependent [FeFe] hydrogenase, group A6 [Bacteroidales bacterium]|nr:NADH-dependent [FeFe] hydrogenase, group A6 [Bacteroidales bacterium]